MNASRPSREPAAEEIGIEPGPPLQELQRRILAQDPGLARDEASPPPPARTILAFPSDEASIAPLVAIASGLAADRGHEVVAVALVRDAPALARATARLDEARAAAVVRGARVRTAAFTSLDAGADALRLVTEQDVALLLLHGAGRPA